MAKYVKAKDVKIGEKVCVRFKDKKTGKAETVTGWVLGHPVIVSAPTSLRIQTSRKKEIERFIAKKDIISIKMLDHCVFHMETEEDEEHINVLRSGTIVISNNNSFLDIRKKLTKKDIKNLTWAGGPVRLDNGLVAFGLKMFYGVSLTKREGRLLHTVLTSREPVLSGRVEVGRLWSLTLSSKTLKEGIVFLNERKVTSRRQGVTVRPGDNLVVRVGPRVYSFIGISPPPKA